jgi:hypothetical protein
LVGIVKSLDELQNILGWVREGFDTFSAALDESWEEFVTRIIETFTREAGIFATQFVMGCYRLIDLE